MTLQIKQNEDNWQQTISEFHMYLQNTVELLAHKQENTDVEAPSLQNPRIAASSKRRIQVIPEMKHLDRVLIVAADKEQMKKPSTRRYSSPLWVGLGDEETVPSTRKTKPKRKTKS